MLAISLEERILCNDDHSGFACAELPFGYSGPCAVHVEGRTSMTLVFPDVAQAEAAAKFAVGPLGGYVSAHVRPAEGRSVTHPTWQDWAF